MRTQADVAKNLRAIEDMAARLEARAVALATRVGTHDDRGIVGGEAMVALAGVGSIADWTRRTDLAEAAHEPDAHEYEDPDEFWSPLQMLWFWSESARRELCMDHDDPRWHPTLASEANFLRNADVADWMWNQFGWDDYAKDVERAHAKLETILVEGERTLRGVPCLYDECKRKRLVRKLKPMYRTEERNGEKIRVRVTDENGRGLYEFDDWHCPKCHRKWTGNQYAAMVTAAHEETKFEDIKDPVDEERVERWCTYDYAARKVDRPASTIRAWVKYTKTPRGDTDREYPIATACIVVGRRTEFVRLEDVERRHEQAQRRTRAA